MATVGGIGGVILWFAADAWVRHIVQDEVADIATGTNNAGTLLSEHNAKLQAHEREIVENEGDIKRQDDRFTDFVREIIAKL
jgi:hypothetical protein